MRSVISAWGTQSGKVRKRVSIAGSKFKGYGKFATKKQSATEPEVTSLPGQQYYTPAQPAMPSQQQK